MTKGELKQLQLKELFNPAMNVALPGLYGPGPVAFMAEQHRIDQATLRRLFRIAGIQWREYARRDADAGSVLQLAYCEAADVFGEVFTPRIIRLTSYSPIREPFSLFYIEGEDCQQPAGDFRGLGARLANMGCHTRNIDFGEAIVKPEAT